MTETANSTSPLRPGTKARLTADAPQDWGKTWRKGQEFEIEEFVPALKEGEEGYGDPEGYIQGDFYYGLVDGEGPWEFPADIVEQVMTPEQMSARKLPTKAEVFEHIRTQAFEDGDHFDLDSIETEDGGFTLYGETNDGLRFGAIIKVTVENVWRTDF